MFNKIKKEKTMYTINTLNDFVDSIINETRFHRPTTYRNSFSNFEVDLEDDGRQRVTIPVIGHNPKNISVDVTETEISIKSVKEEGTSRYVRDIDLTLSVGEDYDGTKTEAKFENGLLTLHIDKKINKKAKTVKISY